jgi:hypothetical protein
MNKKFHIIFLISVFLVGWLSFWQFSLRVGVHPSSWRLEGARKDLNRAIERCYSGNDNERTKFMLCVQKKLTQGVKKWELSNFLHVLEERLKEETSEGGRSITQCHDLTHAVGWAAVMSSGSVSDVLPQCSNLCVSGCQHGAISAWYGMGQRIVEQLPTICEQGIDWSQNPTGKGGCFHEVGHAVSSIAGNNIEEALRFCDRLPEYGRIDCGHGVFMELFEPATFATAPLPLPENHPRWCETLWEPYRRICYNQAGAHDYGRRGDEAHAFAVCLQAPLDNRAGCFRNLGQNIFYVYQYKSDHIRSVVDFCSRAGNQWFFACLEGVLSSSVYVEPDPLFGSAMCRTFSDENRRICFGLLATTIEESRGKEMREKYCKTLPSEEQQMCIKEGVKFTPY